MRKLISSILVLCLALSTTSIIYADYETMISYVVEEATEASETEEAVCEYEFEVPETILPGETKSVTLVGTWDSNTTINVSTAESVTLTNSSNGETVSLDVSFAGINQEGVDEETTITIDISLEEAGDLSVGVWEGIITYDVDVSTNETESGTTSNEEETEEITYNIVNLYNNSIIETKTVAVGTLWSEAGYEVINDSFVITFGCMVYSDAEKTTAINSSDEISAGTYYIDYDISENM